MKWLANEEIMLMNQVKWKHEKKKKKKMGEGIFIECEKAVGRCWSARAAASSAALVGKNLKVWEKGHR